MFLCFVFYYQHDIQLNIFNVYAVEMVIKFTTFINVGHVDLNLFKSKIYYCQFTFIHNTQYYVNV